MARLNIKRRTRQVDDAREVRLSGSGDHVIHTTAGQLAMSGDDKAHLAHNLKARRGDALVAKLVARVQEQASEWLSEILFKIAPKRVCEDMRDFEEWRLREGIDFVQDGLDSVVRRKGRVLAIMTADVPLWARDLVVEEIRRQQRVARGSKT